MVKETSRNWDPMEWFFAIIFLGMIVFAIVAVSIFTWCLWLQPHTKVVAIEIVNGNQTGTCNYIVTVKGNPVQSGTLQPGEAIVLKATVYWHGNLGVTVKVSNGILTLEKPYVDGHEPIRFIIYPDEIREIGTIGD